MQSGPSSFQTWRLTPSNTVRGLKTVKKIGPRTSDQHGFETDSDDLENVQCALSQPLQAERLSKIIAVPRKLHGGGRRFAA
jgi:hypothetical protein